jgi:hypothetical protein
VHAARSSSRLISTTQFFGYSTEASFFRAAPHKTLALSQAATGRGAHSSSGMGTTLDGDGQPKTRGYEAHWPLITPLSPAVWLHRIQRLTMAPPRLPHAWVRPHVGQPAVTP